MKMHVYQQGLHTNGRYSESKGTVCEHCLQALKAESEVMLHDYEDGTLILLNRLGETQSTLQTLRVDNPAQHLAACETLQSQPCDCCGKCNEVAA